MRTWASVLAAASICIGCGGGHIGDPSTAAAAGRGVSREVTLPSVPEMRAQIEAYDAAVRKRYVASKRHTIQVDTHTYRGELRRERRTRRA